MNKITELDIPKKKCVIFDMDGTILNTLKDLAASLNFALAKNGYPARTENEVKNFVGNGLLKLAERGAPNGAAEKVYNDLTAYYAAHRYDYTAPYKGIDGVLKELKARKIKLAVLSNKADAAVRELCEKFFKGIFDYAAGERAGVKLKPEPDALLSALSALGCKKSEALYVGDSDVDILTARNAGVDCASVTWGFRDRGFLLSHGATKICDTPAQILKLINGSI